MFLGSDKTPLLSTYCPYPKQTHVRLTPLLLELYPSSSDELLRGVFSELRLGERPRASLSTNRISRSHIGTVRHGQSAVSNKSDDSAGQSLLFRLARLANG